MAPALTSAITSGGTSSPAPTAQKYANASDKVTPIC